MLARVNLPGNPCGWTVARPARLALGCDLATLPFLAGRRQDVLELGGAVSQSSSRVALLSVEVGSRGRRSRFDRVRVARDSAARPVRRVWAGIASLPVANEAGWMCVHAWWVLTMFWCSGGMAKEIFVLEWKHSLGLAVVWELLKLEGRLQNCSSKLRAGAVNFGALAPCRDPHRAAAPSQQPSINTTNQKYLRHAFVVPINVKSSMVLMSIFNPPNTKQAS
ncbi:hypothetical protein B0T18DRAFT_34752 [Schizothecium vesticola]|uniref:Uncharacterized protein n=1 Tax=Schizothecium vesticola TaxID=314040 RepID=A0AA40FAW7_9PEZI|nr:hypothetical protein B0T18DRAFT_34752 [Schizothecium vesticola]